MLDVVVFKFFTAPPEAGFRSTPDLAKNCEMRQIIFKVLSTIIYLPIGDSEGKVPARPEAGDPISPGYCCCMDIA